MSTTRSCQGIAGTGGALRSNRVAIGTARAYPEGHMTNAPDFSLDDELDATA